MTRQQDADESEADRTTLFPMLGYTRDGRQLGITLESALDGAKPRDLFQLAATHRSGLAAPSPGRWAVWIAKEAPDWVHRAADALVALRARRPYFSTKDKVPSDALARHDFVQARSNAKMLPATVLILAPAHGGVGGIPSEVESSLARYGTLPGRLWFDAEILSRLFGPETTQEEAVFRYIARLERMEQVGQRQDGSVLVSHPYASPTADPIVTALLPSSPDIVSHCSADRIVDALHDPSRDHRLWVHLGGALHVADSLRRGSPITKLYGRPEPPIADEDILSPERLVGAEGGIAVVLGCYTGGTSSRPLNRAPMDVVANYGPSNGRVAANKAVHDIERCAASEDHMSGLAHALLGGPAGFGAIVAGVDQMFQTSFSGPVESPAPWKSLIEDLVAGHGARSSLKNLYQNEAHDSGFLFPAYRHNSDTVRHASFYLRWANLAQLRILGDPWLLG